MKNRHHLSFFMAALLIAVTTPTFLQADTLVVLNKSEATASLIDLESGKVRATLATDFGPHEAATSPDGRLALVGNYGSREKPGSSLTVIDVPGAKVVKTIDLGEYRRPHGLLFLPDGRRALVTAEGNRALLLVDVEKGVIERSFETDQDVSHMVEVALDGRKAFVANIGSGSVSVIDLKKGIVVRTIETGAGAEGITASIDGKEIWVTNRSADTVSVIDAESLEILKQIPCASFPIRAKATPDGKHVLVSCARSADIAVLDAASRKEVRRIPQDLRAVDTGDRLFGDQFGESSVPIGIVIHPSGKKAWVAHTNADVVVEIDLESWEIVRLLEAGREPDGMAYSTL
ncbi:MAG: beta-propeller fold lactonase family protein, partial [Acidobacteria bacterium]|nr:beta-propeller fold lactonase family protein [Candidatus Sulfomarinibacter kjeldsenii]